MLKKLICILHVFIGKCERSQSTYRNRSSGCIDVCECFCCQGVFHDDTSLNFDSYYAIGQQTARQIQDYGYSCSIADIQTLESMVTKILEERVQ